MNWKHVHNGSVSKNITGGPLQAECYVMLQAAILQLTHQFAQTEAVVKVPAPAGTEELPSGRSIFNVTRGRCQMCWCFLCPDSRIG